MATLIDSYPTSNVSASNQFNYASTQEYKYGQTFYNLNKSNLSSVSFYLYIFDAPNVPVGTAWCEVYAHTGTYGVNGKGTGTRLAISNVIDVSTLSGYPLQSFTFTGVMQLNCLNLHHML